MIKTNWKSNDRNPLSAEWANCQRMTNNRLSFFGKGITCIDKLDNVHQNILTSIKQLDLSHNALTKIENMKQFPNLQIINLAHNHIADGKQISKLAKLYKLKTVLIKGNPFLKSGQGKIQALKTLISVDTDIQILTNKLELYLGNVIKKYCRKQIKKQYLAQICTQLQLISEYSINIPQKCSGSTYMRLINNILQEKIQVMFKQNRQQVIRKILSLQSVEQFSGLQTKEHLQEIFEQCLVLFDQNISNQIMEQDKLVADKLQILEHVKCKRKENLIKQNYNPTFKKPSRHFRQKFQHYPKIQQPRKISLNKKQPLQQFEFYENQNKPIQQRHRKNNENDGLKRGIQEKFETYYYNLMNKYNPVYQLLYSPLHSLKSKQKDLLIQTLSNHLKQKCFAVFKNEKIKIQLQQANKKIQQKQRILKISEQKFLQYKTTMNLRIQELEDAQNQKDNDLQKLKYQYQRLHLENAEFRKRISYFQQQLGQFKLKDIKNSSQIQKYANYQQICQKIQIMREKRIKKEYIATLNYKSQHFLKLKNIQTKNRQTYDKNLKIIGFQSFRQQFRIKKMQKHLIEYLNFKKRKIYIENLMINSIFNKNQQNVKKLNKYAKIPLFFQFLRSYNEKNKYISKNNERINKQKKIKIKKQVFELWKNQAEDKKNIQNLQNAGQYYKQKLKLICWKNWQYYIKELIYKEAQLSVNIKTSRTINFFKGLQQNKYISKLIQQKFMNLIIFLNKNKRIKHFQRFKQFICQNQQIRNNKQLRINKKLKGNYFYQFIRITSWVKSNRLQNEHKSARILSIKKKQMIDKMNNQAIVKQIRKKKLNRIIQSYRKHIMASSLRQSLKQFMIQDKLKKNDIKWFFTNLQALHREKQRDTHKRLQLNLFLNSNKKRIYTDYSNKKQFILKLMKPKQQKKRLVQFLNKKYFRLMTNSFKNWRVQAFKGQIQYLKMRIHQFGPQIEQISKRQKTTIEQKMVLMNIIDNKQKTIKGFMSQLQQAQYTIRTKQQKYQKLKQYFYQTQDVTVMGSKVVPSIQFDNRIPQRDFDTFLEEERKQYFDSFRRF